MSPHTFTWWRKPLQLLKSCVPLGIPHDYEGQKPSHHMSNTPLWEHFRMNFQLSRMYKEMNWSILKPCSFCNFLAHYLYTVHNTAGKVKVDGGSLITRKCSWSNLNIMKYPWDNWGILGWDSTRQSPTTAVPHKYSVIPPSYY
jgi:hypothetical protein